MRIDLTDRERLADCCSSSSRMIEPDIEGFEHAVDEFKDRVPDLASGL